MKKQMQKHALSIAAAVTMLLGGGMQLYAADKNCRYGLSQW